MASRILGEGCPPKHWRRRDLYIEGGSNSVGRVIAFQAIGRGFESRLPLQDPAHVAQSVERVLGKDEVTSSILVVGSIRMPGRQNDQECGTERHTDKRNNHPAD